MRFFRIQEAGISFEDMQSFDSADGGDGNEEGLCVSGSPDKFGGAWSAYGDLDGEVVVMEGRILVEIYDGYRIYPTKEIARFSKAEWRIKLNDETAWDYE